MSNLSERTQAPVPYKMNPTQNRNLAASSLKHTATQFHVLPFDMARELYAKAVQLGLIQRSLLASSKFGRQMDMLEKMTLGPWARRV